MLKYTQSTPRPPLQDQSPRNFGCECKHHDCCSLVSFGFHAFTLTYSHVHPSQLRFVSGCSVSASGGEITKNLPMAAASSPLTFDLSLDNVFEKASVIEQPLGNEAYGVHSPGFEPLNYMETLRSVYSRRNPPVTITLKCTKQQTRNSSHHPQERQGRDPHAIFTLAAPISNKFKTASLSRNNSVNIGGNLI